MNSRAVDDLMIPSYSESELTSEIYHIIQNLVQEGRISGNPENVRIERVNREVIRPCRRSSHPNSLNLEQLEWAANNGHFWFLGPIKSLKVILNRGKVQETLVSELNRISFITILNELNYEDFTQVKSSLVKSAANLGFRVQFSQPSDSHNVKVSISAEKNLSERHVKDFLAGIEKVLKAI